MFQTPGTRSGWGTTNNARPHVGPFLTRVSRVAALTETFGSFFTPTWDTINQDDVGAWSAALGKFVAPNRFSHAKFTVYSCTQTSGGDTTYIQIDGPTFNRVHIHQTQYHGGGLCSTEWVSVNPGDQWFTQVLVTGGSGTYTWAGNNNNNVPYFQAEWMQ